MEHRTNAHKLVLWLLAALSALCAALALAVLLPGGARTAHAAENGHTEHGTDWTALFAEGGKLTGGNYYLAADVELTTALTVSGPVTLCLNGYVLTGAGSSAVIMIGSGGDFMLCDCQSESAESEHRHAYYVDGNGKYVFVTDTSDPNYTSAEEKGAVTGGVVTGGMQHGIYVYGSGIFTMQGGTIAGNTAETHGGGVYINNTAAFTMSGVSFTDASYIYDGSEKTLTITGTLPDGVTVEYTANTLTDAGSVEVTASFTGDKINYNEIAVMTATLTIERAIPAYTLPEGLTATEGDTLADVALPDGWNWADDTLSVGEEGDNSFTAVYTPADTANYQEVSAELTVSVSAAATEDAGAVPGGEETGGCSSSVGIGSAGGAAVIISAACALIFKKGKRSDL